MQGMNRETGKLITERDHLRQSIETILNTRIGTRVMRPEFGSELPELVAAPMNPETDLRIYAATIDALTRWEPRLLMQNVQIEERTARGELKLTLTAEYYGETVEINGIRVNGIAGT